MLAVLRGFANALAERSVDCGRIHYIMARPRVVAAVAGAGSQKQSIASRLMDALIPTNTKHGWLFAIAASTQRKNRLRDMVPKGSFRARACCVSSISGTFLGQSQVRRTPLSELTILLAIGVVSALNASRLQGNAMCAGKRKRPKQTIEAQTT